MKKFFVLFVMMFSVIASSSAQSKWIEDRDWKLHVSPTVYGGYNCLENAPIAGVAVPIYVNFIRAELDFGYTYLNTYLGHKDFMTFSPSIGVQYGNKVRGYAMYGWTTWANITKVGAPNSKCPTDRFYSDLFHHKIKGGVEVILTKKLFLNAEVGYVFSRESSTYYENFSNLSLRAGLGWRF